MNLKETVDQFVLDYKKSNNSEYYHALDYTLYISIDYEDNPVPSINSDILEDARSAIVIVTCNEKAEIRYHTRYYIYYFNSAGGVELNYTSGNFTVTSTRGRDIDEQYLRLLYKNQRIYSKLISYTSWSGNFMDVWNVMKIAKACEANPTIKDVISKLD